MSIHSLIKYLYSLTVLILMTSAIQVLYFNIHLTNKLTFINSFKNLLYSNNTIKLLETINKACITVSLLTIVIIVMTLTGLWGVIRENRLCLLTYSIFTTIFLILQIYILICIKKEIQKLHYDILQIIDATWNNLLTELKHQCKFHHEWRKMQLEEQNIHNAIGEVFCDFIVSDFPQWFYERLPLLLNYFGCEEKIIYFWNSKTQIVRFIVYGLAAVEIFSVIFAVTLLLGF